MSFSIAGHSAVSKKTYSFPSLRPVYQFHLVQMLVTAMFDPLYNGRDA